MERGAWVAQQDPGVQPHMGSLQETCLPSPAPPAPIPALAPSLSLSNKEIKF